jgi:DNA repair protein RecN (Recombination protein N)
MITNLLIKNYALIKHLSMKPSPQFNTITGETGAGKSIMLGAIGLLLGKRADTRVLFSEKEKCVIEGVFDVRNLGLKDLFDELDLDYQDECIIRREITPAGKSRAFINDTPVVLDIMKTIGDHLVDVHSQRDTLLLGSPAYQINIIDAYAGNDRIREAYKAKYRAYKEAKKNLDALQVQAEDIRKEADYNHFLHEELEQAQLKTDEQGALEEELKIIEHAEEIKKRLNESIELLKNTEFSTISQVQEAVRNLGPISQYAEHFKPVIDRLNSCHLELKDIADELESEELKVEFDQNSLEEVQERLSLIYRLQQKHGVSTIAELLSIRAELDKKVSRVLNLDKELEQAEAAMKEAESQAIRSADQLSASRQKVIPKLKKSMELLLRGLGMPHATIDITHNQGSLTDSGQDDMKIMFSANVGVPPDELKHVASGGEFSRLMFAVKYILADKTSLPTIIFDEIDSGVSGEVALKMVQMMGEMSSNHQVVAITHLPQIAARGDRHFYVYKEPEAGLSVSKIKSLDQQERELEIAKMIGGDRPSGIALENARELLNGIQHN